MIKLLPYVLFEKIYSYFSTGNVQPSEPALCQLYRHAFNSYSPVHRQRWKVSQERMAHTGGIKRKQTKEKKQEGKDGKKQKVNDRKRARGKGKRKREE